MLSPSLGLHCLRLGSIQTARHGGMGILPQNREPSINFVPLFCTSAPEFEFEFEVEPQASCRTFQLN